MSRAFGAFGASGVSGLLCRLVPIGSMSRIGACARGGLTGQFRRHGVPVTSPGPVFRNAPARAP
jgi:hypothetical protein